MKTRTKIMSKTSRSFDDTHSEKNIYESIFPIVISGILNLIFFGVFYLAYIRGDGVISSIFLLLGICGIIFMLSKFHIGGTSKKYYFFSDYRDHDTLAVKNHYNYGATPKLKSIAQTKILKILYYNKYSLDSLITFLAITFIIIFLTFYLESIGIKETKTLMLSIIFIPVFSGILNIGRLILKLRKNIKSKKNRFYFISRLSKKLGFVSYDNELGGEDYYFQK